MCAGGFSGTLNIIYPYTIWTLSFYLYICISSCLTLLTRIKNSTQADGKNIFSSFIYFAGTCFTHAHSKKFLSLFYAHLHKHSYTHTHIDGKQRHSITIVISHSRTCRKIVCQTVTAMRLQSTRGKSKPLSLSLFCISFSLSLCKLVRCIAMTKYLTFSSIT